MRIDYNDNFVTIGSFFGVYSISPNKKYLLGWGTIGDKNGYVLLENNEFVLKKFDKNIGVGGDFFVSNNGNFIFFVANDLDKLKGTFYAMNKSGEVLIKKKYNALIDNIGLSPEGNFAVCSTNNSNSRKDSCTFSFFDLCDKTLLWQMDGGGSDFYEINEAEKKIYLKYRRLTGKYAYDFSGSFLDEEKLAKDSLEHTLNNTDGCYFVDKAKEEFSKLKSKVTIENAKNITELLDTAFKRGFHDSPYYTGWAYRIKGEIDEALNDEIEAIKNFEIAFNLYPKIGIKKRLKELKEKNKDNPELQMMLNTIPDIINKNTPSLEVPVKHNNLIENKKTEIITIKVDMNVDIPVQEYKQKIFEINQNQPCKPPKKWYEFWKQ